jgi:hypothetical protein
MVALPAPGVPRSSKTSTTFDGRSYLWLTEDEATAFDSELNAVLKKYEGDRDAAHHPEGTRRVFCLIATVPES